MTLVVKILLFLLLPAYAKAQSINLDSLKAVLRSNAGSPIRFRAAAFLNATYQELNRDTALYYANEEIAIAAQANNKIGEGVGLVNKAFQLIGLGQYAEALKCLQGAFTIADDADNDKQPQWNYYPSQYDGNKRLVLLSHTHHLYAILMRATANPEQEIEHFIKAASIAKEVGYTPRFMIAYISLGETYNNQNKPDSALYYEQEAEQIALSMDAVKAPFLPQFFPAIYLQYGISNGTLGNEAASLSNYYKSIEWSIKQRTNTVLSRAYLKLSEYYITKANKDSALYYSLNNYRILQTLGLVASSETNLASGYKNLYLAYQLNQQFDSAYKYQALALHATDSLAKIRIKNLADFQTLTYSEQLRLQALEQEKKQTKNKILTYSLVAGLVVCLFIGLLLYRNNRQKQKANLVLHQQKQTIENTLHELKSTQQQLIQSEKMASLGELTAGIAHEIQNPLNFVNNFSEVSNELIDELNEELNKGDIMEAKAIGNDIKKNLEKINHHGKRADAIVKGMLQHSRQTAGVKEPTDINALCDEYLRLSYHGLRAKDKSFNADFKTAVDESIGKLNIVPQDMGRVLLNLFNNAFYAVNEKQKDKGSQLVAEYKPAVSVRTKKWVDKIEISVSDNGNGIPQKILDKIFQPFFTTKPTGQGTGLGLSLAYDIVKAHGGQIQIETRKGEETVFIIQLPLKEIQPMQF